LKLKDQLNTFGLSHTATKYVALKSIDSPPNALKPRRLLCAQKHLIKPAGQDSVLQHR